MMERFWAWARNLLTHPTVEVAFVQAVLSFAISQGMFSLTVQQTGVVMATATAVTGLVAAALTHQALVVWLISLGQARASLIVCFDFATRLHWDTKTVAAWIGLVVFALGLVQHSKASPKYGPLAESRATAGTPVSAAALDHPAPRPHRSRPRSLTPATQIRRHHDAGPAEHRHPVPAGRVPVGDH